jgi:WD40 repeat protein
LSRDGRLFAAGQNDGRAQVWDTGTGDHKHTLKHEGAGNHTERIEVVALSPDGDRLATANRRDARLWDLTNAGQALILNDRSSGGYTPQIRTITFAPDGRLVATGDDSGDITLWDAITGKRLHAFPDGTRKNSMRYTPVSAIAFSRNGNQLAAGTFEPHIRFNPSTVTSDSPAAWLQVWN